MAVNRGYDFVLDNLFELSTKKYSSNVIEKVRFLKLKVLICRRY